MSDYKEIQNFLIKQIIYTYSFIKDQHLKNLTKNQGDGVVTNYDYEIESFLTTAIKKEYPEFNIISEETTNSIYGYELNHYNSFSESSGPMREFKKYHILNKTIIIDPIDGTNNLQRDGKLFGIQCAYYDENDIQLSIIYLPELNKIYTAIKNKGAFLNGKELNSDTRKNFNQKIISLGEIQPYDWANFEINEWLEILHSKIHNRLIKDRIKIREYGSVSIDLAFCAEGLLSGNVTFTRVPWDIVPGILLCKEAGLRVEDIFKNEYELGVSKILVIGDACAALDDNYIKNWASHCLMEFPDEVKNNKILQEETIEDLKLYISNYGRLNAKEVNLLNKFLHKTKLKDINLNPFLKKTYEKPKIRKVYKKDIKNIEKELKKQIKSDNSLKREIEKFYNQQNQRPQNKEKQRTYQEINMPQL